MQRIFILFFFLVTGLQATAYDIFVDRKGTLKADYIISHADSLWYGCES